jgi:hypothetical protein
MPRRHPQSWALRRPAMAGPPNLKLSVRRGVPRYDLARLDRRGGCPNRLTRERAARIIAGAGQFPVSYQWPSANTNFGPAHKVTQTPVNDTPTVIRKGVASAPTRDSYAQPVGLALTQGQQRRLPKGPPDQIAKTLASKCGRDHGPGGQRYRIFVLSRFTNLRRSCGWEDAKHDDAQDDLFGRSCGSWYCNCC